MSFELFNAIAGLRVGVANRKVYHHFPRQEKNVKHAKAFGRGYGALEQIYRWAATSDPEIKRLRPNDKFIAQIKRTAKQLGWRA